MFIYSSDKRHRAFFLWPLPCSLHVYLLFAKKGKNSNTNRRAPDKSKSRSKHVRSPSVHRIKKKLLKHSVCLLSFQDQIKIALHCCMTYETHGTGSRTLFRLRFLHLFRHRIVHRVSRQLGMVVGLENCLKR